MSEIKLEKMFQTQFELDSTIHQNHNVDYSSTKVRRVLALLVELGELANATRCFKFWSNKPSESKERVLDEYADGLHFLLSLGVVINTSKKEYDFSTNYKEPTEQFLEVYHTIDTFKQNFDEESYTNAFQSYFDLLKSLGFTWKEAEDAYYKKVGVNYHRQETNY